MTVDVAPAGPGAHASSVARAGRLLIFTDAWAPQVNGVVRTLETLGRDLEALGCEVRYATPQGRFTVPLPTYPEIRLALFPRRSLERMIDEFAPDAIHIATEGTIGLSARAICRARGLSFTTSFHTRFPEYVHARFPLVPKQFVYRFLRWFHGPATAMMVATPSLKQELEANGFRNVRIWARGVDVAQFRPIPGASLPFPHPIWLSVGRIAVEKNIETFLKLDLPGTKVIIGDGPARSSLARAYPDARFLGPKSGEELVRHYAASDVFVFPSLTDTFGLVMLEALACGVPVAAFPVQGPIDVLGDAPIAALDCDLARACLRALEIPRLAARAFALTRSWRSCTEQFLSNLPVRFPIREVEAESSAPDAVLSTATAPVPLRAVL
jgi:1,2-diacylglycerol 3-alpha-glucosyltransferase/glucuronosyltransferase